MYKLTNLNKLFTLTDYYNTQNQSFTGLDKMETLLNKNGKRLFKSSVDLKVQKEMNQISLNGIDLLKIVIKQKNLLFKLLN